MEEKVKNACRLRREDCKKKWTYTDENGAEVEFTPEELAELLPEWKREDCGGESVEYKVGHKEAYAYYFYDYDEEKYKAYREQFDKGISNYTYGVWGLLNMINEDFLKSPACANWSDYSEGFCKLILPHNIEWFAMQIYEAERRLSYLKYWKQIYKSVFKDCYKEGLLKIAQLMADTQEQYKQEKKEAAEAKKQQREKETVKAEYTLTLDEIVAYANEEAEGNVGAIRAMLRYFYTEKKGWEKKEVLKKIKSIGNSDMTTVVNGDMVQEKHVNTQIGTAGYEK